MSLFDEAPPQPIPQARAGKYSEDHLGNYVDVSALWLKQQEYQIYIQALVVHINDQAQLIEVLQEQVEDLLERVTALETP